MKDYKVNLDIKTIKGFDSVEGLNCLDVMSNMSKDVTRFYYKAVEEELLRSMPNQILLKISNQFDAEIKRRETNSTGDSD